MLVNLILNKEKTKSFNEKRKEIAEREPEYAKYLMPVEKLSDIFIPYLKITKENNNAYIVFEDDYRDSFNGVYMCGLNSNYDIEHITDYKEKRNFKSPLYFQDYGVCDNASQVLDYYDKLFERYEEYMKDKLFVIFLTPIFRKDEPETGGWRWHKWGPYIGKYKPRCEYIHDEKGIDYVFCFHIYEVENIIKNATFTSVWDGGYKITTRCKVNTETKEVFDVEKVVETADCVNELDYEFVTIDNIEYPVSCDKKETEYWYK